jgi:hypothetical protein
MLKHLCCDTPVRRVRIGWVSFQPKGDISFGLFDKTYIAPQFKARIFVWNAYNRARIRYLIPSTPDALEAVKNPHFTYHAQRAWFHLKPSRKHDGEALFEAIADIPITLQQNGRMPWIRATSSPMCRLAAGGQRQGRIKPSDLVIRSSTDDLSIAVEVDFIRPDQCEEGASAAWEWSYAWGEVGLRIRMLITHPRSATLGWFHFH